MRGRALIPIVWMVLVAYSIPMFVFLTSAILSKGFTQQSDVAGMIISLMINPNEPTAIIHRILLPLVGAFAPIAFMGDDEAIQDGHRVVFFLLILLILNFFCVGLLSYDSTSAAIRENVKFPSRTGDQIPPLEVLKISFGRMQEGLGIYIATILGLRLADASRQG